MREDDGSEKGRKIVLSNEKIAELKSCCGFWDFGDLTGDIRVLIDKFLGKVRTRSELIERLKKFVIGRGNVGFILKEDGEDHPFVVDPRFKIFPKTKEEKAFYRYIKNKGFTPEYIRRINFIYKTRNVVKVQEKVKEMTSGITIRKKEDLSSELLKAARQIRKTVPINVLLLKRSFKNIEVHYNQLASELKEKGSGERSSSTVRTLLTSEGEALENSFKEGIRQALLAKMRVELKGKMLRLIGTTAENPDLEHGFLEWRPFPSDVIFERLSRFGCQHDFEILPQ